MAYSVPVVVTSVKMFLPHHYIFIIVMIDVSQLLLHTMFSWW